MVDPILLLRYLLTNTVPGDTAEQEAAVASILSRTSKGLVSPTPQQYRIWSPRLDILYNAKDNGAAITFFVRSGSTHPEVPIISPSMQIIAWDSSPVLARTLYHTIWDRLQGLTNLRLPGSLGFLMSCLEQQQGQDLIDPVTNWNSNLSFWSLQLHK